MSIHLLRILTVFIFNPHLLKLISIYTRQSRSHNHKFSINLINHLKSLQNNRNHLWRICLNLINNHLRITQCRIHFLITPILKNKRKNLVNSTCSYLIIQIPSFIYLIHFILNIRLILQIIKSTRMQQTDMFISNLFTLSNPIKNRINANSQWQCKKCFISTTPYQTSLSLSNTSRTNNNQVLILSIFAKCL